jgi:FMN phosphatase YigB (HAD superfamily)
MLKETSKRILFLDWDGTVSRGRFWSGLDETAYNRIQACLFSGDNDRVQRWLLGGLSSEEICRDLASELGLDSNALLEALRASCEVMKIDGDLISALANLSTTYEICFVTDNMDCFSRFTVPALDLDKVANRILNSSDLGRLKRDNGGLTFCEAASAVDADITECHLIDDSEKNCRVFAALGGQAHLTTGPERTMEIVSALQKR